MRIVGGTWAGRDLASPGGRVRPTPEEVRSAWVEALGDRVDRARIVDLFAGTGALGLEALSRGARHVDFVENGPSALHSLKANVARFRVRPPGKADHPPTARILKRDAIPFVDGLSEGVYDVAFADAPYGSAKLDRVVAAWNRTRFAAVLGVEHDAGYPVPKGGRSLKFERITVTLYGMGTDAPVARPSAPRSGSA